jgi:hypothetical protein
MNTQITLRIIGVFIINLICILVSVASIGGGHGTDIIVKTIFPFAMILVDIYDKINLPVYFLTLMQFPIYAIVYYKRIKYFKLILALHILAVIFVFYMK